MRATFEPVIPIHITDDWNVITRTILPIINQPSLFPGMSSATGLGDLNPTFFLVTGEARRADLGRWGRHSHCRPPPTRFWGTANSAWVLRQWC